MPLLTPANALRIVALTVLVSALGACGFHLRGATAVPDVLSPIHVDCAGDTPAALCEQVRELLALNKVPLSENPTEESYILRLVDFESSQRATAITATAGAAEYDLRLETELELIAPGPVPLLTEASIAASEVYRYDEVNVLAKRREREELTEQLYQRLAQQIIYRLSPFTAAQVNAIREAYRTEQESQQPQPGSGDTLTYPGGG